MPHTLEPAPTGRAKCRGCGQNIAAKTLRFGEQVPNAFSDEEGAMSTLWYHPACGAYRRPEAFLDGLASALAAGDLPDRERLEHEARLGVAHHRLPRVSTAERASSGRAACRHCKEKIDKDGWRISLVYYEDGRFSPSGFVHLGCAPPYFETPEIPARLFHFSPALSDADRAEIGHALAETTRKGSHLDS